MNPPTPCKPLAIFRFCVPVDNILRRNLDVNEGQPKIPFEISFSSAVLARMFAWFELMVDGEAQPVSWVLCNGGLLSPYGPSINTQGLPVHRIEIDPTEPGTYSSLTQLPFIKRAHALGSRQELEKLLQAFMIQGHIVSESGQGNVIRLKLDDNLAWFDVDTHRLST
ncbi:MAG: hypothetical protein HZA80_02245 [Candidatus Taylorbacteria bacterium]|nr:hypothetical protein [Candidatus Taylorbacteria bacterium]